MWWSRLPSTVRHVSNSKPKSERHRKADVYSLTPHSRGVCDGDAVLPGDLPLLLPAHLAGGLCGEQAVGFSTKLLDSKPQLHHYTVHNRCERGCFCVSPGRRGETCFIFLMTCRLLRQVTQQLATIRWSSPSGALQRECGACDLCLDQLIHSIYM